MSVAVGLTALLALLALGAAVAEAMGKAPSFLSPMLASLAILINVFPK